MRLTSSRATMRFYLTPLLLLLALLVSVKASVENDRPVQSRYTHTFTFGNYIFNFFRVSTHNACVD